MLEQFKNAIKNQPSLFVVIFLEIVSVALMSTGVIPRDFSVYLTAILLIFIILAPLKEAVLVFVFSIPFFTALTITDNFDSMASWRILMFFLFLRSAIAYLRASAGMSANLKNFWTLIFRSRLGVLVSIFFVIGALSFTVSQDPFLGVKKLAFLANIFALFFVINFAIKSRKDIFDILQFSFAGALGALAVGYGQFASTFFVPLFNFWQWWVTNVIPVFYGSELADLLTYSNTWFSYYKEAEATLRMFSVFPDSHSFALFMLLATPIALAYFVFRNRWDLAKVLLAVLIVLLLMSLILSGTRGTWVGAIPVFLVLLFAFLGSRANLKLGKSKLSKVIQGVLGLRKTIKVGIISFLLFALLFPISSQLLQFSQIAQGGIASSGFAFERISNSLSTRELSNKGRIEIWQSTLKSIAERPFLGVGVGNYPAVLGENLSATKEGASAHSLYLDVIAEMGILAGVVLFLIFMEILWRTIKTSVTAKDKFLSLFSGLFAIYFVWIMAYSVVDVVLLNDKVLLFFVTLIALIYAISREKYVNSFNNNRRAQ